MAKDSIKAVKGLNYFKSVFFSKASSTLYYVIIAERLRKMCVTAYYSFVSNILRYAEKPV